MAALVFVDLEMDAAVVAFVFVAATLFLDGIDDVVDGVEVSLVAVKVGVDLLLGTG